MMQIYTSENNYLALGNGKTERMVEDSYNFHLIRPEYKIIANFDLSFADETFKIDDLVDILKNYEKCLLLIDEIHILLHAYETLSKGSKKARKFFTETRKKDLYVKVTSQSYNDIQAPIRRLNPEVFVMRKVHIDNSLCWKPKNSDCEYDFHIYQKHRITFVGNTCLTTHIKPDTTGHKIDIEFNEYGEPILHILENFYYKMYNSNELILLDKDLL